MEVDVIIVGLGIAGMSFAQELTKKNKSFIVFEDDSQNSSKVAGGMYNPVILKRFTPVWDAQNQLEIALPFYKELEKLLGVQIDYPLAIKRLFTSIEEQNDWFTTCDKPFLSDYMIPKVDKNNYNGIASEFGYGTLINTGRVDTKNLLAKYTEYLSKHQLINKESFNYSDITFCKEGVNYHDITSKYIVFCEGYGIKQNPFFKELPMQEAKGELLLIHAPDLAIDFVLKSSVFIMPVGNCYFKVGATFNWKDKTNLPTEKGKEELRAKLDDVINVPYEIVDHVAGIRPTIKDRRPLVGVHKDYKQLAILNGLGTRGVMIAPMAAKELYSNLFEEKEIRKDISIKRFDKN